MVEKSNCFFTEGVKSEAAVVLDEEDAIAQQTRQS
jgi:hypothetical protein